MYASVGPQQKHVPTVLQPLLYFSSDPIVRLSRTRVPTGRGGGRGGDREPWRIDPTTGADGAAKNDRRLHTCDRTVTSRGVTVNSSQKYIHNVTASNLYIYIYNVTVGNLYIYIYICTGIIARSSNGIRYYIAWDHVGKIIRRRRPNAISTVSYCCYWRKTDR